MSLIREDPYLSFNFEVNGIVIASFSEVSGLAAETDVEEYREGGENYFIHKLPKVTRQLPLVLKRGMTSSTFLYDWYRDVVMGKINTRNITVSFLDRDRSSVKTWTFQNSFPVKWNGPDLKADGNTVAIESVELVHQGLVWVV
jgi:phage tail-like protein